MELAVIGKNEFTIGFRLAGIKKVINTKEIKNEDEKKMKELLSDSSIGIVITDHETFEDLGDETKYNATNSIQPVIVVVSGQPQEELRNMIIRSIGIDLLKGDA